MPLTDDQLIEAAAHARRPVVRKRGACFKSACETLAAGGRLARHIPISERRPHDEPAYMRVRPLTPEEAAEQAARLAAIDAQWEARLREIAGLPPLPKPERPPVVSLRELIKRQRVEQVSPPPPGPEPAPEPLTPEQEASLAALRAIRDRGKVGEAPMLSP